MHISRFEEAFERQVKIDVVVETILDYWEKGRDITINISRSFVRDSIKIAVRANDRLGDLLCEAYEMYDTEFPTLHGRKTGSELMEFFLTDDDSFGSRSHIKLFTHGHELVNHSLQPEEIDEIERIGGILEKTMLLLYSTPTRRFELLSKIHYILLARIQLETA